MKSSLPNTLCPLQLAYHSNSSTEDRVTSSFHRALTQLEGKNAYARILFIHFSSAINTITTKHLFIELSQLCVNNSLHNWVLDFLQLQHNHTEYQHTPMVLSADIKLH